MNKILAFALLLVLCAGCISGSSRPTIGVAVMSLENDFTKDLCYEFRRDMDAKGYDVRFADADMDSARQLKQIDGFLADYRQGNLAALVVMPVDAKAIDPAVEKVIAAKLPVFSFDTGCCASNRNKVISHIATDNYNGGRTAAKLMMDALGNEGKVMIVGGWNMEASQQRIKGFKDALADAKSPIVVAAEVEGYGEVLRSSQAVFGVLKNDDGSIKGIFAVTDPSALGAVRGCRLASRDSDVKIIGFGGSSSGRIAVQDGRLYATLGQSHEKLALEAANLLDAYLRKDGTIPPSVLLAAEPYSQQDICRVDDKPKKDVLEKAVEKVRQGGGAPANPVNDASPTAAAAVDAGAARAK